MSSKPERIVVIADAHVGLAGLQPDGRTYGDSAPLLERAVQKCLEASAQRVVLLGDIVNRGYPHEYQRVKDILAPLVGRLEPIVGNHELQRASVADFEAAWGVAAVREIELCGLPAPVLNSGIEGLPDSQWHGRLDRPQLDMLDAFVDRHRFRPAIIICHHPVAGTVRASDKPMLGLENSAEVLARLQKHKSTLLLVGGHTHAASVVRGGAVTYLGCPALGFWPHAMVVLQFGPTAASFQTIRLVDDPADSPDPDAADLEYREIRGGHSPDWSGTIPLG